MRPCSAACLSRVERFEAQLFEQRGDLLRTESRNAQHLHDSGRDLRFQVLQLRQLSRLDDDDNLVSEVFADAFELQQLSRIARDDRSDIRRQRFDRASGIAVRSHAERVRTIEFQQVGEVFKDA